MMRGRRGCVKITTEGVTGIITRKEILIGECYDSIMKRSLVEILACPVCKGELELKVAEEGEGEVIKGTLRCGKCNHDYPIEEGIPNLLPPEKG
jgi:uncharacterized protein YbaR (Trm112 family)